MHDLLNRLYQAKIAILAVVLFAVGLGLLVFGHWIQSEPSWGVLHNWPIIDIGSGMFTTGLLAVAWQYVDGQDGEARDTERLRRVLAETAPSMRDAVIHGFAFEPNDLAQVATPEVLDRIVVNALGLQLHDPSMAEDLVEDLRAQAVEQIERLEDLRITIRLSMDRGTPKRRAPKFIATIHWECRLKPVYPTRRFICISDSIEYRALEHDTTATSSWYIGDRSGLDAGDKETFELVDFTVDGTPAKIWRAAKHGGQTYTVSLGEEAIRSSEPVTLAYTYRTLLAADGHLLRLRADQPTKGLAVTLDYGDTNIEHVSVLDYVASGERVSVNYSAPELPDRLIDVAFPGWVLPRSGIAFVWSLEQDRTIVGSRKRVDS